MSSVKRGYAQRNHNVTHNNLTQLVPQFVDILPETDISGASLYDLTIPNVQFTNSVYYVDLSGVDLSGNLLNVDGKFYPFFPSGNTNTPINIITFTVTIPVPASHYPGLEFTIFFKNIPFNRIEGIPLLTIGIIEQSYEGPPIPYIVSPPFPSAVGQNVFPSITMKSDGTNYNVVSSGPAGWMGVPALSVVLAAYNGIP
jgi:hypothetical protein